MTVRLLRTCDFLVIDREQFALVLKAFPRHKQRVDSYIAGYPDSFFARNPALLQRGPSRGSGKSAAESGESAVDLNELRSSGALVDELLTQLDVAGAQLAPALLARPAPPAAGGLRRTLFSRFGRSTGGSARASFARERGASDADSSASSSPPLRPASAPPSSSAAAAPSSVPMRFNESNVWNLEESVRRPLSKSSGNSMNDIDLEEMSAPSRPQLGPPRPNWHKQSKDKDDEL